MTARKEMFDYMTRHNYSISDYPAYSKDLEWQRLNEALVEEMAEENILMSIGKLENVWSDCH